MKRNITKKDNQYISALNMTSKEKQKVPRLDRRKDSNGSASKVKISSREKVVYVDEIDTYLDTHKNVTLNKHWISIKHISKGK